jgi:hypothetical protein
MIDDYDPRPCLLPPRATVCPRAQRPDSVGQYTNLPRTVQEKHFGAHSSIATSTYYAEVDYLQAVDEREAVPGPIRVALAAK